MDLKVESAICWKVKGEEFSVVVFEVNGKWKIKGKGGLKYRKEIIEAVQSIRKNTQIGRQASDPTVTAQ